MGRSCLDATPTQARTLRLQDQPDSSIAIGLRSVTLSKFTLLHDWSFEADDLRDWQGSKARHLDDPPPAALATIRRSHQVYVTCSHSQTSGCASFQGCDQFGAMVKNFRHGCARKRVHNDVAPSFNCRTPVSYELIVLFPSGNFTAMALDICCRHSSLEQLFCCSSVSSSTKTHRVNSPYKPYTKPFRARPFNDIHNGYWKRHPLFWQLFAVGLDGAARRREHLGSGRQQHLPPLG